MTERLDKVKLVKGPMGWFERMDDLDNIGISTFTLIKDAIEEGRNELAKDLTDYLFIPEHKLVHDVSYQWLWGWPSFVQSNYGEDTAGVSIREAMRRARVHEPWVFEPKVAKRGTNAVERLIWGDLGVKNWRTHRMGKHDGLLGFIVEEYEDRIVLYWDPCASGGRMRRGDPITGTPSRLGPPYNLGVTQTPHPWSWGKTGVSLYCCHCCIRHEQVEVEQNGYLNCVIEPPEPPEEICRMICYKDEEDTPEEYYARIGKTKPTPTSTKVKSKDAYPKLIRVIHSNEFATYPYTQLKKAIDLKNKEEALKVLEDIVMLRREGGSSKWNWAWMDIIVEKYGYNELYHAIRSVDYKVRPTPPLGIPKFTKNNIPSAEERARQAALWGRSDRSGPNTEGSVRIIDEPDRIVMELDPCGSGGRQASGDLELNIPSALDPPYNLGVTTEAHPVAWGKVGIPHYCARCCVHEEMGAIAQTGYLTTIVERPENVRDPSCRWFFYKDLDDIPEYYYSRIGAKKPVSQLY